MSLSINQTYAYMLASRTPLLENKPLCGFLKQMDEEETRKIDEEAVCLAQGDERLKTEIARLDEQYSWKNILRDGAYTAFGIGALTGASKYGYDHSPLAEIKNDDEKMLMTISMASIGRPHFRATMEEQNQYARDLEKRWLQKTANAEKERLDNSPKESVKWFIISSAISALCVAGGALVNYSSLKNSALSQRSLEKERYTLEVNGNRSLRLQHKVRMIEERLLQPQDDCESNQLPIAKDYFNQKNAEIVHDRANNITINHRIGHV